MTEQARDDTSPTVGSSNSSMAQPDEECDFDSIFVKTLIDFESTAVSSDVSDQDTDMEPLLYQHSRSHSHPDHDDASASIPIPNLALHAPPMEMIAQSPSTSLDVTHVQQNTEQFGPVLPLNSSSENGQSQYEICNFDESSSKCSERPNEEFDERNQECDLDLTIVTMLSDFESTTESIDISDLDIDLESIFKKGSDLDNQSTKSNSPVSSPTPDYQAPLLQMADQEVSSSIDMPENEEQFEIELPLNSSSENVRSKEEISNADEIHSLEFHAFPLQITARLPSNSINMPANAEQCNIERPLNSNSEHVQSQDNTSPDSSLDFHDPLLQITDNAPSCFTDVPDMPAGAEQLNIEIPLNSNSEHVQSQDNTSPDSSLDFHEPPLQITDDATSCFTDVPDMPAGAEQLNIEIPLNSNSENVQSQDNASPDSSLDFHEPPLQLMDDATSCFTDVPDMPANAEQVNVEIPLNSNSENVQSQDNTSSDSSLDFHEPPLQIMDDAPSCLTDVPDMPANAEQFNIEIPLNSNSENVQSQDNTSPDSSLDFHEPPLQIMENAPSCFTDVPDMPANAEQCNIEIPLNSTSENVQCQDNTSPDSSLDFHEPPLQIMDDAKLCFTDVPDMPANAEQCNIEIPLNSNSENVQCQGNTSPDSSLDFHEPPLQIMDDAISCFTDVSDMPANAEQCNIEIPLNSNSEHVQSKDEMSSKANLHSLALPLETKVQTETSSTDVSDMVENAEKYDIKLPLNSCSENFQSQDEIFSNTCISNDFNARPLQIMAHPAISSTGMPHANAEQFNTEIPLNSNLENMQSQDEMSPRPSPYVHVPNLEVAAKTGWISTDVPEIAEQPFIELAVNSSSESVQGQKDIPTSDQIPISEIHVPSRHVTALLPTYPPNLPENAKQFDIELSLNSTSQYIPTQAGISTSDESSSPEICAPPLQMTAQPASSSFDVPNVAAIPEKFNNELKVNSSSESVESQTEKSTSDKSPRTGKGISQFHQECDFDLIFDTMQPDIQSTAESTDVSDLNIDMESIVNQNSKSDYQSIKDEASNSCTSPDLHAPPWQMTPHSVSNSFEMADAPDKAAQFDMEQHLDSNSKTLQMSNSCSNLAASILPLSMPLVPPLALEVVSKDNFEPSLELDYDSASDLDMESETDTIVDSDEYSSADDSSSTIILTCRSLKHTRDMKLTTEVQESIEDNTYSLKLPVSGSRDMQFMAQTIKVQDWIQDNYFSPKSPVSDSTQDTEFTAQTTMVQESIDENTDSNQSPHQTDIGHEVNDFESIVEFLDEVHLSQEPMSKKTSENEAIGKESIAKDSTDHDTVSQGPMDLEAVDDGSMTDDSTHYTATDKEPLNDLLAAPTVMQQDVLEPNFKGFDQEPEDHEIIDKEATNQKLVSLESAGQDIFNKLSFDQNSPNDGSVNDEFVDPEPNNEQFTDQLFMTQLSLEKDATDKVTIDQEITNEGSVNDELEDQESTDERFINHQFMIQLYTEQDATDQAPIYQAIAINESMCDNATEPQHVSQEFLEQERCEEQSCYQKAVIQLSLDRQAIDQVPYAQDVAIIESMSYKAVDPDKVSQNVLEDNRREEQFTDHKFMSKVSRDQHVINKALHDTARHCKTRPDIAINEYVLDKAVDPQRSSEKSPEQHQYEEQPNDNEIMIQLSMDKDAMERVTIDKDTAIAETVNDKTVDLENVHYEFLEQNGREKQFSDQELWTNYAMDEEFTDQEFKTKLSTNQDAIGEESTEQESMTNLCPDQDSFCEEFTDLDLTDNYETCEESIESMPDALIQEPCIGQQQSIDQISSQQLSFCDESSDHGSVESTPQESQDYRLLVNEQHDMGNGDEGCRSDWVDDHKNINHRLLSTLATAIEFTQSEGKYSLDLNPQRDKNDNGDEDEISFEYHSFEDVASESSIDRDPACEGFMEEETAAMCEKATEQGFKEKQTKAQVILDSRSIDFKSVLQQFNNRIAIQQRALEGRDVNKELADFDESACKRSDFQLRKINAFKSNFMSFGSDALEPNDADLINPPTKFKDWHQQCRQQQQEQIDPLDPDPKPPPTVDHNPTTFKTAYMIFHNLEAKEMEDECSELSSESSIDSEDWITHRSNLSDVSTESGLWMNIDQKFVPLLKSEIQFIDSEFRECSSSFNSPRVVDEYQDESPAEIESLCDCEESSEEEYLEPIPMEKESLGLRSIELGAMERGLQRHGSTNVGFLKQGPEEHGPIKIGSLNRGPEGFESLNVGSLKRGTKSHRASMNLRSLEGGHRYHKSSKHISMISKYMEQISLEEGRLNKALADQDYEDQEFMDEYHLDIKEDVDL